MPLRECDTGSRLQISFERDRAPLIGELDHHVKTPGTTGSRVQAVALVVRVQAGTDI